MMETSTTPPSTPSGRIVRLFATAAANRRPGLRPGSWCQATMRLSLNAPNGGLGDHHLSSCDEEIHCR
uniref:Uncharacterized protein n=1 Tax=Arundo donax TaxID=35708 RepID=A0A0A9AB35_ARUDO